MEWESNQNSKSKDGETVKNVPVMRSLSGCGFKHFKNPSDFRKQQVDFFHQAQLVCGNEESISRQHESSYTRALVRLIADRKDGNKDNQYRISSHTSRMAGNLIGF